MPDPDTTLLTPTATDSGRRRLIGVRVLAHPDPARVGDFAPLFDGDLDGRRRDVSLSRLTPAFRTSNGQLSGPLASPRLTRNPLELSFSGSGSGSGGGNGGGLRLRYAAGRPDIEVNGVALQGQRIATVAELDAGLVVLIGKDLAVWIGWMDPFEPVPPVAGLVGESTVMRKLRQQIHRVADLDVPVLLRGATGVGKELVAAAIHKHSRRAGSIYAALNLASVPPTMAASELFGHKRGAFTGAFEDRKGYFAQADGGTLFLDEIGDVSFDVQALLLRAVQEGVIQPLGGNARHVDVRLIAATDSDLESAVARREFREPLLRRFSYEIRVPPLRARNDDVGVLFYHLLRERLNMMGEGHRLDASPDDAEPFVPAAYVARMALYEWPGNVRELANVALKLAVENRGRGRARIGEELWTLIRPRGDVAREGEAPTPSPVRAAPAPVAAPTLPVEKGRPSDEEIVAALQTEDFRRERAAKRLGVSKSYLYKRLAEDKIARAAADIPADEVKSALASCPGNLSAAAGRLRVSTRALRLQLKRLGLPGEPDS